MSVEIMKVLILNAGVKNKGNEALVASTVMIVRKYMNNIEFMYMGSEKSQNIHIIPQLAQNLMKSPYPWFFLLKCFSVKILRRWGFKTKISKKSKLDIFTDVDVVINSGGDQLSGEKFIGSSFLNILYPIFLDKPIVLFAESLGNYKNPITKCIGKYIFKKANLILVRENLSKDYLISVGVNLNKIYVTADPAFILPSASNSRINEILDLENIQKISYPIIGINPSGSISKYLSDPNKSKEHLIRSIADTIDYLIETKGVSIILIPHVYTPESDDRDIIQKIYENVTNTQNVFKITQEYSAEELKGIISLCDIFIGARMHATIAATSLCIPTVGIAYSHKMYGIIGKTLGLEDYIIDINNLDQNTLKTTIDDVWSKKILIKKHLEQVIPEVKEKSFMNGYYFKQYIELYFNKI